MTDADKSSSLMENADTVNVQLLVNPSAPSIDDREGQTSKKKKKRSNKHTEMSKMNESDSSASASETDDDESDADADINGICPEKTKKLDFECQEPEIGSFPQKYLPGPFKYGIHLSYWNVDESATKFWNLYGKSIANKNLFISIGNLFLGFAVWLIWSVVTVFLIESRDATNGEYYSFSAWKSDMDEHEYMHTLWLLPAAAGLSGATCRLTNSFMIAPAGGRNVISQTSILLLIPMVMLVLALNDINVSLEYLIVIALLSGAGGGACSSSMSNISFFYPKSKQGLALGLNAGIGNLGVSAMQLLIPIIVSFPVFGALSIKIPENVGYVSNSALFWIPFLIIFIILAWFGMNSLPQHPDAKNTSRALMAYYYLQFLGYMGAGIAVSILIFTRDFITQTGHGLHIIQAFILWFVSVLITVFGMKYLLFCGFFKSVSNNIGQTLAVCSMKHTWIITNLYTMTFGSFIGFAASFGLLMKDLFPSVDPLHYAWLGPFVASIARPFGGWLSDKFGGARVTHYDVVIMILSTIGVGVTLIFAKDNEGLFPVFLVLFLILFITTGIGNGSTFRMVPCIFSNKEHAGPILGWASAIAAYGAFVIPIIFSECMEIGISEYAFFAFALYYLLCLCMNYYYYFRKGAEKPC